MKKLRITRYKTRAFHHPSGWLCHNNSCLRAAGRSSTVLVQQQSWLASVLCCILACCLKQRLSHSEDLLERTKTDLALRIHLILTTLFYLFLTKEWTVRFASHVLLFVCKSNSSTSSSSSSSPSNHYACHCTELLSTQPEPLCEAEPHRQTNVVSDITVLKLKIKQLEKWSVIICWLEIIKEWESIMTGRHNDARRTF